MIHELKTTSIDYKQVYLQNKKFEVRKNDRDFEVGDILVLKEYDSKTDTYSGSAVIVKVEYIMTNSNPYIDLKDSVIMSIKTIDFIDK